MNNTIEIQDLRERLSLAERSYQRLERIAYIIVIVGVIFGAGGGFGYKLLSEARQSIENANTNIEIINERTREIESRLEKAGDELDAHFERKKTELNEFVVAKKPEISGAFGETVARAETNVADLQMRLSELSEKVDELPRISSLISVIGDGERGCARFPNLQLCWGRKILTGKNLLKGEEHVRRFEFEFRKPFIGKPFVTNGINAISSGLSYALFWHLLTNSKYEGRIVEVGFRESQTPVTMNYTAIGRWQ